MLNFTKLLLSLLITLCSMNVYSQEYIGDEKEIQQILANIKNFSSYYVNGETEKLVPCYTQDGKIFPGNVKIMEGKEDLLKYWTMPDDIKVIKHKITPSEIRIVENTAYDYGYYEGQTRLADGKVSSWKGKYVIVWKKIGEDWKIYLDIWNRVREPKK